MNLEEIKHRTGYVLERISRTEKITITKSPYKRECDECMNPIKEQMPHVAEVKNGNMRARICFNCYEK